MKGAKHSSISISKIVRDWRKKIVEEKIGKQAEREVAAEFQSQYWASRKDLEEERQQQKKRIKGKMNWSPNSKRIKKLLPKDLEELQVGVVSINK